jgi:hypothetical protein
VIGVVGDRAGVAQLTSSGLFRADTGEQLPGSGGQHIFVAVRDGDDIERFLKSLHERRWLAGFGRFIVGAGSQLLERSIIDRMVGTARVRKHTNSRAAGAAGSRYSATSAGCWRSAQYAALAVRIRLKRLLRCNRIDRQLRCKRKQG